MYKTIAELPDAVKKHLPKHAQSIYREAFNHAHVEYTNPNKRRSKDESLEAVSHKVAWNAVKLKYKKGSDGNWYLKEN